LANTSLKETAESKGLPTPFNVSRLLKEFRGYDENNLDISYSLNQTVYQNKIIPTEVIIRGGYDFFIPVGPVQIPARIEWEVYIISKVAYTRFLIAGIKVAHSDITMSGEGIEMKHDIDNPIVGNLLGGIVTEVRFQIREKINFTTNRYIMRGKMEIKPNIPLPDLPLPDLPLPDLPLPHFLLLPALPSVQDIPSLLPDFPDLPSLPVGVWHTVFDGILVDRPLVPLVNN
jgi:hypothetical protein